MSRNLIKGIGEVSRHLKNFGFENADSLHSLRWRLVSQRHSVSVEIAVLLEEASQWVATTKLPKWVKRRTLARQIENLANEVRSYGRPEAPKRSSEKLACKTRNRKPLRVMRRSPS
jgi:hypothetical protein